MARKKTSSASSANKTTFEEAYAKLEEIVRSLEDGQLGLSESLARYEEGVQHMRHCHEALEDAERKILLLTGMDADGNPISEPFEDAAETLEEKQASRGRRRSRSAGNRSKKAATEDDIDSDNQKGLF